MTYAIVRSYLKSLRRLQFRDGPSDYDNLEWHWLDWGGSGGRLSIAFIVTSEVELIRIKTDIGRLSKNESHMDRFFERSQAQDIYTHCKRLGFMERI